MSLLERYLNGDRVALARLISCVEDRRERYHEVLARVFSSDRLAYRIGLTGPPGVRSSSPVTAAYDLVAIGATVKSGRITSWLELSSTLTPPP